MDNRDDGSSRPSPVPSSSKNPPAVPTIPTASADATPTSDAVQHEVPPILVADMKATIQRILPGYEDIFEAGPPHEPVPSLPITFLALFMALGGTEPEFIGEGGRLMKKFFNLIHNELDSVIAPPGLKMLKGHALERHVTITNAGVWSRIRRLDKDDKVPKKVHFATKFWDAWYSQHAILLIFADNCGAISEALESEDQERTKDFLGYENRRKEQWNYEHSEHYDRNNKDHQNMLKILQRKVSKAKAAKTREIKPKNPFESSCGRNVVGFGYGEYDDKVLFRTTFTHALAYLCVYDDKAQVNTAFPGGAQLDGLTMHSSFDVTLIAAGVEKETPVLAPALRTDDTYWSILEACTGKRRGIVREAWDGIHMVFNVEAAAISLGGLPADAVQVPVAQSSVSCSDNPPMKAVDAAAPSIPIAPSPGPSSAPVVQGGNVLVPAFPDPQSKELALLAAKTLLLTSATGAERTDAAEFEAFVKERIKHTSCAYMIPPYENSDDEIPVTEENQREAQAGCANAAGPVQNQRDGGNGGKDKSKWRRESMGQGGQETKFAVLDMRECQDDLCGQLNNDNVTIRMCGRPGFSARVAIGQRPTTLSLMSENREFNGFQPIAAGDLHQDNPNLRQPQAVPPSAERDFTRVGLDRDDRGNPENDLSPPA